MPDNPHAPADDWRKSYDHVFTLPPLGCAWEFLRRNPKLASTWAALKPAWQETQAECGLTSVRGPVDASPVSPCLWASSLDDAATASVIWSPNATSHVLKVAALPPRMSFGGQVLDLEFVAAEKTVFVGEDGSQQLLFRQGPRSLQLDVHGAPVTEPVVFLIDTAAPQDQLDMQLNLLRAFHELRVQGDLPEGTLPPHPYARRAAAVLMALDGYLAGVSHRDIALAMFGEARVARDWADPGEHMRDAVRRAVARGVTLMEGGYRMFLH